jgi:integrase/recombinase XerD
MPTNPSLLIEQLREDCETRGMSDETIRRYVSSLRIFFGYLEGRGLSILDVDKDAIKGFLKYIKNERKVGQKTIKNYFCALSSSYDFLEYEEHINKNPIDSARKRLLRQYKTESHSRKLISIDDMSQLINSSMDVRGKAIIAILAKTGIRLSELLSLDVSDIDWVEQSIMLKPTHKRTNRMLFFDEETALILRRWIRIRENRNKSSTKALFVSSHGRMSRNGVYVVVTKAAERVGLHNPNSTRLEDHFSPHCCRHWFTTHLRRAGMPREFIRELRGDVRKEAIDIYDHIDLKELKES